MSEPVKQTDPSRAAEASWGDVLAVPLGLAGAVIGGVLGVVLVKAAFGSGLYAMPIVGLPVGYGTILLARRGGVVFGVIAGVMSLVAAVVGEWQVLPFVADPSLGYFFVHLGEVFPFHLLLMGLAGALGLWIGWTAPRKKTIN